MSAALTRTLFAVAFIEGYAVLAAELIAIRLLLSYVGNGTDVVAIIIAAVLLPLALGYYVGSYGRDLKLWGITGKTLRARLQNNFLISTIILTLGIATPTVDLFFTIQLWLGGCSRLMLTTYYAGLFLVVPIFLLGQTIPLISALLHHQNTPRTAGLLLFWSTLGAFAGSILSTIVIMPLLGVTHAAMLITLLLAFALFKLGRRGQLRNYAICSLLALIGVILNSNFLLEKMGFLYQNQYNTARILIEPNGDRLLLLNNAQSSLYNPKTGAIFPHIEKTERMLIDPILNAQPAKRILVLGAGGFSFGLKDKHNSYVYVDIDPDLKQLTEEKFLGAPLDANKTFVPEGARPYLREAKSKDETFDLVYIDVYNTSIWIPEPMTTRDFFEQVRDVLKPDGLVAANIIAGPLLTDKFSMNLNAAFEAVFPGALRIPATDFNAWEPDPKLRFANMIYIGRIDDSLRHPRPYTDNKNAVLWDRKY